MFCNLIKNELTKIFSKKAIYVYTVLILSLVIGVCLIGKKVNEEENSNNCGWYEKDCIVGWLTGKLFLRFVDGICRCAEG